LSKQIELVAMACPASHKYTLLSAPISSLGQTNLDERHSYEARGEGELWWVCGFEEYGPTSAKHTIADIGLDHVSENCR
jgi:hypothetical protein